MMVYDDRQCWIKEERIDGSDVGGKRASVSLNQNKSMMAKI